MALSTLAYKGARDFYPEDKRLQKYLFATMRSAVERFGYEEYDAPLIEPLELYLAKTGQEIVNEQTYTFVDRGERKVAIRPEMTPSAARMVAAKRQELAYPLRWYSIPNLWRYERPQRGRLREHWQLNVDLYGPGGLEADAEIIQLADHIMRTFGAEPDMYSIKINSRLLVDFILRQYLQLGDIQAQTMTKLIDRRAKMDLAAFEAEVHALFSPSQREAALGEQLIEILDAKRPADLPPSVRQHASVARLQKLADLLGLAHVSSAELDLGIMRGFDYYTDIVFEVFDTHPDNNRSLFGGGRYDGLVGLFGVEPVPTIGFGMGDVTLANFLEIHRLLPKFHSETEAYVALIGDVYEPAQHVISQLRRMGLNVAVDMTGRSIDKQIKTADKKHINYVIFIGQTELASGQFNLKNLITGEEGKHSAERIVSVVKDFRNN
ncbi:MAG: histidine--tRNA ligase [Candidatus Saccharimonadales bacterium]